ncbi:MAG: SMP-30/gluconolactonase/LRE family protein [Acidobacteriota bacterium]
MFQSGHRILYLMLFLSLSLSSTTYSDGRELADGEITTIAGRILADNDLATKANLQPTFLTLDKANNLFIVDAEHSRVRRVDAKTKIITTIAGNGNHCDRDCPVIDGIPATEASLNQIGDIALDSAGNLYIAEIGNIFAEVREVDRVRRVDAVTGIIVTFAGGGKPADGLGDGGLATEANLLPFALAIDHRDNLLIGDSAHHTIRRVDANTGIITTIAGNGKFSNCDSDGLATEIPLNTPADMAIDKDGSILFTCTTDQLVRRLDNSTNTVTTIAGNCYDSFSGDGGPAINATFNTPLGIALDRDSNIFIVDSNNMRIRRIDAVTGIITTVAGDGFKQHLANDGYTILVGRFSGDGGPATKASLFFPSGIVVDNDGNLIIADTYNSAVRRVDRETNIINTIVGRGREPNYFQDIPDGTRATEVNLLPSGITVDKNGNIIFSTFNHKIKMIEAGTEMIKTLAGRGATTSNGTGGFSGDGKSALKAFLNNPADVKLDSDGNILIADEFNNRIRRIRTSTGTINTVIGNGKDSFCGDGKSAKKACLYGPESLVIDLAGNIFIVDSQNYRIRRVDAKTGIITTVAGNGVKGFSGDGGLATEASLDRPEQIAIDRVGNLFILEQGRVRLVDANSRIITTVAGGGPAENGVGDGRLATEVAIQPLGIAIDQAGNLFITDILHNRVRRVDTKTRIITTVVGNGEKGYSGDNGPATKASLRSPGKLIIDGNGNLFMVAFPGIRVVKGIAR